MMIEFTAKKIAGLVLLFSAGVAGAVVLTVGGDDKRPATPAGTGDNNGTGTVIGGNDDEGGEAPVAKGVFYISGQVGGLVPGKASSLPITVTNPNPYPIHVLTVDTGVVTPPTCPAGSLRVGRFSADTTVTAPARGTVEVSVPVELTDSTTQDQSGCAGVAFPLTFTGTARTTS